jgi:PAS domain S-box-containing protein
LDFNRDVMTEIREGATLRVCVADDDEVDRLALKRYLSDFRADITFVEAADASAAIELVQSQAFDCLLLGLNMPGRDGLSALRELRAAGYVLPIIVLSGHGDEETAVSVMKAGATGYLAKSNLSKTLLTQRLEYALRLAKAEAEAERASNAAQASEALLSLIVDSVPALIAYIDKHQRYRWLNVAYQNLHTVPRSELVGKKLEEVVGPAAYAAVAPYVKQALQGTAVSFEQEIELRGKKRWLEGTYVPHHNGAHVEGFVAVIRDVTERHFHGEQVSRQRQFEQELVGMVSHDLRNPISVIMMGASVLQRRADTSPEAQRTLSKIINNSERMVRMVSELLDFTQARLGGAIPVQRRREDMHQLARLALDSVQMAFPDRKFTLETHGDGAGEWDPDRIVQILTNLLTNAIDYSPADSMIQITSHGEESHVRLSFHNSGEPIPEAVLPVIFEPFRRGNKAKTSNGNVGLGLYIVKQLVDAHQGRIEVSSQPDTGTTFNLTMPRFES